MNTFRYYLALVILAFVPPAFLFWFSIHPFLRLWRALGPGRTLAIHYVAMLLFAALTFVFGKPLLSVDFGTNPLLIVLAVPLLVASGILRKKIARHLKLGILTGLPELSPERHKTPLLTEGIYARIRHPRYVQFFLGIAGYALICNFLGVYLLLPALACVIFPLVWMEERELRLRFGAEYESYCARVPLFIPRLRP